MAIPVACDSCGTNLKVAESAAGRSVRCPKCEASVLVPHEVEAVAEAPVRVKRRRARPKKDSGPSSTLVAALIGAGVIVIVVAIGAIVLIRHFRKESATDNAVAAGNGAKSGVVNRSPSATPQDAPTDPSGIKSQVDTAFAILDCMKTVATSLESALDDESANSAAASIESQVSRLKAIHQRMLEIGMASPDEKAKIAATQPQIEQLQARVSKSSNRLHDRTQSAAVSDSAMERIDTVMRLLHAQLQSMVPDGKRLME